MVPPEADEGFKITDRRRRIEDEESHPEEPNPRTGEDRRVAEDAPRAPASSPGPSVASDAPREEPAARADASDRNLAGLFVMLASSAALALGEGADPMTGQVHVDLDQAAELIDVLVLLREKTEGNRTPEESQVLEELIYDLQVRYVAATRRFSQQPGRARS